ncbi:hypothetical protein GALL_326060 [mine drainage metagenome]|uniref:Uncharacterized protein n=1 Tax=mine drainage metagenome TaxID=410659 RepID=A0A1J5R757_9ZZZZ
MTRADRATFRPEFAARFARLREHATSGRQALAAQGALALLWYLHSTASGFVPLSERETAAALDVDVRTWRELAGVLGSAGLLVRHPHGYAVPDPRALEGTSRATGTTGFLRTHRDTYGAHVQRVQRAGTIAGRRGGYVLAALGAFEVLRVSRANWGTGITRWSTAKAGREHGVSAKTWAGYLLLLEHALILERTGTRIRVLGWRQLCWGPPWRHAGAEASSTHNTPDPVDAHAHNLPDSPGVKARAEVTNSPLPPPSPGDPEPVAGLRLRRGEHCELPALFSALEARVPAAKFARWRRSVRQELSHALSATGGDVPGLVAELTRRDFTTANDVPATLGYRCAAAVEVVRARQASRAIAVQARSARAEQQAAAGAAAAAEQAWVSRLGALATDTWPAVLARVAGDLPWMAPGTPSYSPGQRRMLEAEARSRVLARANVLVTGQGPVERSARSTSHGPLSAGQISDLALLEAIRDVAAGRTERPADGS